MSMNGIDISAWQRGINLSNVPFDFVIVKATEGTKYINGVCDSHCEDAIHLRKCFGVYHYANGGDYKQEADFFLEKVKKYVGKALLVLDWESQNNPQFGKTIVTGLRTGVIMCMLGRVLSQLFIYPRVS